MRHVHVHRVWFYAKPLSGATASGILNPNSVTRSLSIFTEQLNKAKRWQQVLLQLGEVDCGFVIWHRAQRHGLDVEDQLVHTLEAYTQFISKVVSMGFSRVIVLSVPLPTIDDYPSQWGEVANLRKEITASQRERTDLTLRFNNALRDSCATVGAEFVDVTTGHLDSKSGLIDQRFLRKTNQDHHLSDEPYAELIANQLSSLRISVKHG
jgi:hypothetical protein